MNEVCKAVAGMCVCTKPKDHPEKAHVCGTHPGCGGSWVGDFNSPDFRVLTYPGLPPGTSDEKAVLETYLRILGLR